MRRNEHQARHVPSALHGTEDDEGEMRRCRFDILMRYNMHENTESAENIVTGSQGEQCDRDLRLQTEGPFEAPKEWFSDPGCIPREVNAMQVKDNISNYQSENQYLWSGQATVDSGCHEPKSHSPRGMGQLFHASNDEVQESECLREGCPPHLIAGEDQDDDEEEDESLCLE
ncbi:hypothetical protein ACHAW6_003792 [Cyclotella cf. meneghiniana]